MRRRTAGATTGVVLLLGAALLTIPGGSDDEGYIATGAADTTHSPSKPVPPTDDVTLTPLDGPRDADSPHPDASRPDGTNKPPTKGPTAPDGRAGSNESGAPSGPQNPPTASKGTEGGSTGGDDTGTPADNDDSPSGRPGDDEPTPSAPDTGSPALLELSTPDLADTDTRWCEKVTLNLHNTGGQPVREGTLTFHTHIIGGLGIDWATRKSTRPLPAPLPAGATEKHTWKICVDAWRVPLGMHIDTKNVDADWK
ncbi:hypothetical protein ABZ840_04210 [Streptomyces sp. NPDC047117]|uniref:hypothetical protein n=1 Tax=Streptomyces sp. NPDC047117 TaxID=3155379 RepID=UPI0033E05DBC